MLDHGEQDDRSPRAEIVAILAKESGVDPARFVPDTPIRDLDIASIDLVQAIFAIETRFDIEIPPGVESDDATVDDFIRHILSRIEHAAKPSTGAA